MKDIEILEQIKKKETESVKKSEDARKQAVKLIERAKIDAAAVMEEAKAAAATNYTTVIERAKKDAEMERSGIIEDAVAKSQAVKRLDKPSVMRILQKAIKDRFGG